MSYLVLSIPVVLLLYSAFSLNIGVNWIGALDHVLFVLVFFLIQYVLSLSNKKIFRIGLRFFIVLFFCLYFVGNVLYFRFFQTWLHFDLLKQWGDVPAIWQSLVDLITIADMGFGLMLPLVLFVLYAPAKLELGKRLPKVLLIFGLALFFIHLGVASPHLRYSENNPFSHMARRKIRHLTLSANIKMTIHRIGKNAQKYQSINTVLYNNSEDSNYPFEKVPRETEKSLFDKSKAPNVVLVLLESFRAFESGSYGASPSFTPHFDSLAKEGLLVQNFYANAAQTHRAEFSILNSYYPNFIGGAVYTQYPNLSIVSLPHVLKRHGYDTLWISSFSPKFSHKQRFLSKHGIQKFFHSVPAGYKKIGWGPSDEDLFDYASTILNQQESPFFAEIMTLSNHHPFNMDYPTNAKAPTVKGSNLYQNYTKGIYYTDFAMGQFIRRARQTSWGQNTLFIVTGDHGIWTFPPDPRLDNVRREEIYFRVPLLFLGPGMREPRRSTTLASQIDIAPTVLDYLGIQSTNSFLGASFLEENSKRAPVLMIHDERWNYRRGNEYLYDAEIDRFRDHFPFISNQDPRIDKETYHEGFTLSSDLLRTEFASARELMSEEKISELESFVKEAIVATYRVLDNNKISRPSDAFDATDSRKSELEREEKILKYVAHAGGSIQGLDYTNSLESLNENYKKGFRAFEIDFGFTSDGHIVLIHDWDTVFSKYFSSNDTPTLETFVELNMINNLTQLTLEELIRWIREHRDAVIITDFKRDNIKGLRFISNTYPELIGQFIPQVYDELEYSVVKDLGARGVILTLYQTEASDEKILTFTEKANLFGVTMSIEKAHSSDLAINLKAQGHVVYAHTINDRNEMEKLVKKGVSGFYTDVLIDKQR